MTPERGEHGVEAGGEPGDLVPAGKGQPGIEGAGRLDGLHEAGQVDQPGATSPSISHWPSPRLRTL